MAKSLAQMVADLEEDQVLETVKGRLAQGERAASIIDQCREGLTEVGERFSRKEYYLADLVMSAEIFRQVMALVRPRLATETGGSPSGVVVLGTVKGDIHDMGKNIVAALLSAAGFQVHDVGVDVPPQAFSQKVKETGATFVGLSALLTTAFSSMKETIDALSQNDLRDRVKVMIGGAVVSDRVKEMVGADFYGPDAISAVRFCQRNTGRA